MIFERILTYSYVPHFSIYFRMAVRLGVRGYGIQRGPEELSGWIGALTYGGPSDVVPFGAPY